MVDVVEVDMVAEHGTALADAIEAALPDWVERSVARAVAAADVPLDRALAASAKEAGHAARSAIGRQLRELLLRDIDEQTTTPLALVRQGVGYATDVLAAAGVPAPARDRLQAQLLPDDIYDLAPATFSDIDPAIANLGIVWGAAKAYEHLRRHAEPTGEES